MPRTRSLSLLTRIGVSAAFFTLANAGTAHAVEPAPASAPTASAPASADAPAPNTQEANMAEARKQFQAGVNLLDDPDGAKYEEAYLAFRKAYELSQSPKVLGNMGFCAMHLERDGEAIDAYSAYLREAPDVSERERIQVQRDLETMTSTVAKLRVVVKKPPQGKLVIVDTRTLTRGANVENTYPLTDGETTLRIRPGRHTIRIKAGTEESIPYDATVEPGTQTSHDFVFPPPKATLLAMRAAPARPSIAGPVVLGVAGLLALGAGAASGLMARSKTSSIASQCPDDVCPASYDLASERTSAKTYGTIADGAFIGGGVLLGSALLWYVLLPSRSSSTTGTSPAQPLTAWAPGTMCGRDGCAFQLQRGF